MKGTGVVKDETEGLKWLIIAADAGHPKAIKALEEYSKEITSDQYAEAEHLAREWKPKLAQ